jgi:hypothetical protein
MLPRASLCVSGNLIVASTACSAKNTVRLPITSITAGPTTRATWRRHANGVPLGSPASVHMGRLRSLCTITVTVGMLTECVPRVTRIRGPGSAEVPRGRRGGCTG